MELFELAIITPTESTTVQVEWLEVDSPTGSFLVCAGHSPLVSMLKTKSSLTYKPSHATPVICQVSQGLLRVADNKATVLLDT